MEIRNDPFPRADITRPNRETIERGRPAPPSEEDVRTRLAEQRAVLAERAAAARQARLAERAQLAREQRADRIANARAQSLQQDGAVQPQAADTAEVGPSSPSIQERAQNVREAMLADRAQNARESLVQQRVEAARDKVSLSETSLRLRAHAARAEGPSDPTRADRIQHLRELHQQGSLNTDELVARAAFKMLSGDE